MASRAPEPQDAQRRPTRFQLLQARFMGSGREPRLKRTREVGRLIFRDKQGPGRGVGLHRLVVVEWWGLVMGWIPFLE